MDFSARLFRSTADGTQNAALSPLSALYALGMLENGAREETLAEMEQMTGLSAMELNVYLYAFRNALMEAENEDCALGLANSLWLNAYMAEDCSPDFLQINAAYYDAQVYKTDMSEQTVRDVNGWVSEHTDGMIDQLLERVSPDTYMILLNTLMMQAKWQEVYEGASPEFFTTRDGQTVPAQLLYSREDVYLQDEDTTGFLKPYAGGKLAFVGLLPKEGIPLEDYTASLTGEKLCNLYDSRSKDYVVRAALPKFTCDSSYSLVESLQAMGMRRAFTPGADLTGIAEDLYVSNVLQKVHVKLDESGTEAAAATAIVVEKNTGIEGRKEVVVELTRPFLWLIVDTQTGLPLFMGTVTAP